MLIQRLAAILAAFVLCFTPVTAHAARYFVENTLGDVPADQVATVAEPRPVQVLFQFTTSGAANARATNYLSERVLELIRSSGVFSEVSTAPVEGGAILSVTIDNIPQADAASRGVGVGLTFGLMGTAVADYYVARVDYVGAQDAATITKETRHTLITTLGNTDVPENATRARNVEEALNTIVRQLLAHALNDLARDPGFTGAPPAAVAAAAEPAAETATDPAATSAEPAAAADATPAAETQAAPAPAN